MSNQLFSAIDMLIQTHGVDDAWDRIQTTAVASFAPNSNQLNAFLAIMAPLFGKPVPHFGYFFA